MFTEFRQVAKRRNQAFRDVARMRTRKPDAFDARNLVNGLEKRREITRRIVRRLIVIHDLAEQLDFAVPAARGLDHFVQNVALRSHALVPACVRDDAERAELVAALNDGDVSLHRIETPRDAERKPHIFIRVYVDESGVIVGGSSGSGGLRNEIG
jgi:hypothetical protein